MNVHVTINKKAFPHGTATAVRRNIPELMREIAKHWYKDILPIHFTEEGARKYHYAPREKSYLRRIKSSVGHLVYSGKLYKSITGGMAMTVKPRGVTVHLFPTTSVAERSGKSKTFSGQQAMLRSVVGLNQNRARVLINFLHGNNKLPDYRREITEIAPDEAQEMANMFAAGLMQTISAKIASDLEIRKANAAARAQRRIERRAAVTAQKQEARRVRDSRRAAERLARKRTGRAGGSWTQGDFSFGINVGFRY